MMSILGLSKRVERDLRKYNKKHCVDSVCREHMRHRECVDCGGWTCSSQMRVEPGTLRRRRLAVCGSCGRAPETTYQRRLREQRTRADWEKVSTATTVRVVPDRMPEQYASKSRDAVRAFVAAGFAVAAVPDVDVATLNVSIRNLGLEKSVYAETRDGETILRAVSA